MRFVKIFWLQILQPFPLRILAFQLIGALKQGWLELWQGWWLEWVNYVTAINLMSARNIWTNQESTNHLETKMVSRESVFYNQISFGTTGRNITHICKKWWFWDLQLKEVRLSRLDGHRLAWHIFGLGQKRRECVGSVDWTRLRKPAKHCVWVLLPGG